MTISQLLTAQIGWGHKWGSSTAGRYQIMQDTLANAFGMNLIVGTVG